MSNKVIKTATTLLIVLMIVATLSGVVLASNNYDVNQFTGGITGGADTSVRKIVSALITIIQIIGTGVAIIMLIVLAIKYISAAPSDKAEIKKHAVVYVVGAIVLFAASGILGIVKQFASNISAS